MLVVVSWTTRAWAVTNVCRIAFTQVRTWSCAFWLYTSLQHLCLRFPSLRVHTPARAGGAMALDSREAAILLTLRHIGSNPWPAHDLLQDGSAERGRSDTLRANVPTTVGAAELPVAVRVGSAVLDTRAGPVACLRALAGWRVVVHSGGHSACVGATAVRAALLSIGTLCVIRTVVRTHSNSVFTDFRTYQELT